MRNGSGVWNGFRAGKLLMRYALLCALLTLTAAGCRPGGVSFSGKRAFEHVREQCSYGPRPVGSEANRRTSDYIAKTLKNYGWKVEFQEFTQGGLPIRNVIATKGEGPLILLGTHFDTRPVADMDPLDRSKPVMGANDGASGTAVLLELARVLGDKATGQAEIMLAFFDAEDRGNLNNWEFSVGAQYAAYQLDKAPRMVIIVDMVGDREQEIYYEWNSSLALQERIWQEAASLGYDRYFIPSYKHAIYDDHIPFIRLGMQSALIIDFDYTYWHTTHDTLDKVSADSLQRVGHVLQSMLEGELFAPKPASE